MITQWLAIVIYVAGFVASIILSYKYHLKFDSDGRVMCEADLANVWFGSILWPFALPIFLTFCAFLAICSVAHNQLRKLSK